jgi:DNA-binding NarL/FixJ family response regulator
MASSIYLIEDQELMRDSMKAYLDAEDDLHVAGVAERGEEALDDLADGPLPDLLLIDVSLPGMSGIEFLQRVREAHPDVVCLMLSGHVEETYVEAAKGAGARGYVMKGQPAEYLKAVREILDGGTYRSDTVASMWDKAKTPTS